MKHIMITTIAAVAMMATSFAATFESIPFDTPTYSESDPLGVGIITNTANKVVEVEATANSAATAASNAQTAATEAAQAATNAQTAAIAAQTTADTATNSINTLQTKASDIESSLNTLKESVTNAVTTTTNGTVVVGNMKGTPEDVGMLSKENAIVFGVNRDSNELEPASGQILMAADSIKLDADQENIFIGDDTLKSLLKGGGSGESNKIEVVQTNGVDVAIENKTVNIKIPAPGDANVIESITTNGVALPINGKTIELPNYVLLSDLQDGITFGTMTVSNLTINGKKPSLEGHTHDDKLDATNGVAFGDLKVYPIPSGTVGQTHTIITHESMSIGNGEYKEDGITYSGEDYEFSSDTNGIARLKDVAAVTNGLTITASQVSDLGSYKNPNVS